MAEITHILLRQIRDLAYRTNDAISLYAAIKDSSRMSSNFFKDGYSVHKIGSEIKIIKSEIKIIKSEVENVREFIENFGIKSFIRGQSSAPQPTYSYDIQEDEVEKLVSLLVGDEVISLSGMGGIGKTIKNIKTELGNMIRDIGIDIFIEGQSSAPLPTYRQDFVGREEEVEKLVSLLVDDGAEPVISLWGMGGIGKTTIARKVYSHPTTKGFFDSFAWVSVSREFDKLSVLENVLMQLSPHQISSNLSLRGLTHKLLQVQETTKCMIVVDDIWSVEHWGKLQPAFDKKTKILLITRNHKVAKIGSATKVGLLSDDESWELLKRKSSVCSNIPDFQTKESRLEKMGKDMVGKCGNLPLAISLLGDILSEEKSSKEWDLAYRKVMKGHKDLIGGIHRVLLQSYLDLPYYLKPCFLYMSMYKEGELINGFDLCLMWIAQGMVSCAGNSREVDIAQEYLSELVSRSLVEVVYDDRHRDQTTRMCMLHKVVREMCLLMAEEEDFAMKVVDYEGDQAFSHLWHDSLSSTKNRHLVVNFKTQVQRESKKMMKCHKVNTITVRSLLLINDIPGRPEIEFPECGLKKFKLLKSLYISGVKFKDGKLPKSISKLIVLRSLRLRYCSFNKLPSSVSNLLYLHTLDLWNCGNVQIPNDVLSRMPRLRHLFFPTYSPSYFDEKERGILILEGLENLETLVGFNSLVHRLNSPTEMTKLQLFQGIFHDNQSLSEIIHTSCTSWKNLKCGGLQITGGCCFSSEKEEHVMLFSKLFKFQNLHMSVEIGNLFKELELESQVRISNLQSLVLSESAIMEDPMDILGKLPLLLDLSMIGGCFQGVEITCSASTFPRLERLLIRDLPHLRQWNVEQGTMPVVYKVVIDNCPCLKIVPDGFEFLHSLSYLRVCGMPALGGRVSERGEDFHKVRHVPSIVVRD
ncbi:probable disease resistance protein RXW24L [Salvia splendens]|uniref:probable disease resistance protein RXW24L n=1 Tax=Salvia splendens TaxID=180675 RepID=UPI001105624A|nr:probable disease resistance protein RXW24L [Salvia splendens]